MQCLRLKLYTPTGIFKNPLSIKGIEVYPLPPYSTIIGLIYRAMGRRWGRRVLPNLPSGRLRGNI